MSFRRALTVAISLSAFVLTLATGAVSAQESIFGTVLNISANPTGEDQLPVVAASESQVYVAWVRTVPTGPRVVFRRSTDLGRTWKPPLSEPPVDLGPGTDPELAVAGDSVYLVVSNEVATGVFQPLFRASADAAVSWTPPPSQPAINLSLPVGQGRASSHSVAASGNNVYVVWAGERGSLEHQVVQFRRSADNGENWIPPLSSVPMPLGIHPDHNLAPDIASAGSEVYVTWQALRYGSPPVDEILFIRSTDNGASFSAAVNISQAQVEAGPRSAVATNGSELFVIWGNVFGSDVDTAFRKATIGTTLNWTPPLSAPPTLLIEGSIGCGMCWWDIATSAEGVFVVSREIHISQIVFADLRYRESWDGGTSWLPSISQPAADVSPGGWDWDPSVAASGEHVYVVWESDDQDNDDGRSEIGFRAGHRPAVGAQVRSWPTSRQSNPHWASLNESPSLPLTLKWQTTLPAAVKASPISFVPLGHVYVGADDNTLYALDAADGSIAWSFEAGGAISQAAAAASTKDDHLLFFTSENGELVSLDPSNGSLRWRVSAPPSPLTSAPIYDADLVFYTFVSGPNESTLRAVNAGDGSVAWEVPLGGVTGITPMEVFGDLYVGMPGSSTALVVMDNQGQLTRRVMDTGASPGALTSGVADIDYPSDTDPSDYAVYISTHAGGLRALSSRGGSDLWQIDLPGGGPVTGLALTQNRSANVLVVSQLSHLYALGPDPRTAGAMEILWHRPIVNNFLIEQRTPQPAVWGRYVIHVRGGDELVAMSLSTGSDEWSVTLDASTVSSPAIDGAALYIGDSGGNVYSFENLGRDPVVSTGLSLILWLFVVAFIVVILIVVIFFFVWPKWRFAT